MGIQTPRGRVALLGWLCPRAQLCPLPADRAVLPPDAVGVFTALGLNERLFVVSRDELGSLVSLGRGSGVGRTSLPPSLRGVDGASVWGVRPSPRLSRAPLRAGGLRAPLPCPDPPPRSAGPPHRLLGQPGPDQLQGPGQPPHGLRLEPLQEHPPGPSLTAGRDRVGGIRDAPSPSRCGRWR